MVQSFASIIRAGIATVPLTEFEIIERFFAAPGPQRSDVCLGIGDDAAIMQVRAGHDLVSCVDMLVRGQHFPEDMAAEDVGYRAMAVNLSDMAAMGAEPAWATLALSLPEPDESWLGGFAEGLIGLAREHGVALVGGDTVKGPLAASVQIAGLVPSGTALRRDGAQPGDRLFVTGAPGEAAAGLALWQRGLRVPQGPAARLLRRFSRPQPRIAQGIDLRGIASACIDVSDGLAADLGHLVQASGIGAVIELESLPVSDELAEVADPMQARRYVLSGGDDYELCFAVPVRGLLDFERRARDWTCAVTEIGEICVSPGLFARVCGETEPLEEGGFDHFR